MYKVGSTSWNVFVIFCVVFSVYFVWRATGGIERGEERRALGQDGLFIEVTNVPDSFGNQELFGAVQKATVEEALGAQEDQE